MRTALLIVDMINSLAFSEDESLLKGSRPVAKNIVRLRERFYQKNLPLIYVNDNFGQWHADWKSVYNKHSAKGMKGTELARLLRRTKKDYFVLKPRHSDLEATPLELLLKKNCASKKLVITGIAGDICVLMTARDAHTRDFEVVVPSNCIASNTREQNNIALKQFKKTMEIKTTLSRYLRF